MSIENFDIYIAKGRSLELAEAHFAKRKAATAAREAHAIRHGGPQALPWGTDFTYMGITTPHLPDSKAWRIAPKTRPQPEDSEWPCYTPNTRTKEGKALEEEMGNCYAGHGRHEVFSRPDDRDFSAALGIGMESGLADGRLCLLTARVGQVGSVVVILIPKQLKKATVPADAERIPISRYFAMKEEAEQAEQAYL